MLDDKLPQSYETLTEELGIGAEKSYVPRSQIQSIEKRFTSRFGIFLALFAMHFSHSHEKTSL
jgi:hypothetical protein